MAAFSGNEDRSPVEILIEENEQIREENTKLHATMTRLELFNKILEREMAELKSETPKPAEIQSVQSDPPLNFGKAPAYLFIILICGAIYTIFYIGMSRPQPAVVYNEIRPDKGTGVPVQKKVQEASKDSANKQLIKNKSTSTLLPAMNGVQHYKVRSKAYFHNEPDESTRRTAFITHWNNAIITPVKEKDDFIYVVFTNYLGQTSRGWLRKDELIKMDN